MSPDPPHSEEGKPPVPKELTLSPDEQARALVTVLEGLPSALFVVDTSLRLLLHNRGARQLLEHGSVALRAGHLDAPTEEGSRRLEAFVRGVAAADPLSEALSPPESLTLERPGGPPILVQALLMRPASEEMPSQPGVVALFLLDPHVRGGLDEDGLRHVYGLTETEARVAALIGNGASVEAVASGLNLPVPVVRAHLKQVLDRTHSERPADLIRRLLSGPAGPR
jgi:DNA-binding CsgD family transcriptional regulator